MTHVYASVPVPRSWPEPRFLTDVALLWQVSVDVGFSGRSNFIHLGYFTECSLLSSHLPSVPGLLLFLSLLLLVLSIIILAIITIIFKKYYFNDQIKLINKYYIYFTLADKAPALMEYLQNIKSGHFWITHIN